MLETLAVANMVELTEIAIQERVNAPGSLTKVSVMEKTMANEMLPQTHESIGYSIQSENVDDRDNQQVRPVALIRLGMAIECEGHVTIGCSPAGSTRYYISMYPTVGFTNTDANLVCEIASSLERYGIEFVLRRSKGRGAGKKQRFDLSIHGSRRLKRLIEVIEPHIYSKKAQLDIVKLYMGSRDSHPQDNYSDYEWDLCKQVRLLNKRMPGKKAFEKAKALLETPESIRQPLRRRYLEAYVKMCSELQRELESTVETAVPPILTRWVKK